MIIQEYLQKQLKKNKQFHLNKMLQVALSKINLIKK